MVVVLKGIEVMGNRPVLASFCAIQDVLGQRLPLRNCLLLVDASLRRRKGHHGVAEHRPVETLLIFVCSKMFTKLLRAMFNDLLVIQSFLI